MTEEERKTVNGERPLRVALVVPHIFMHRDILPQVIFSPGQLAISLADGLTTASCEVTLFSPGTVETKAANTTADLSLFEHELEIRGDSYLSLLKKHPFTFITLVRQVQSEIVAEAYRRANAGEFDLVHIYTNEEDIALPYASLCTKPVVFTHHDPYNFLVKYKDNFPKYKHLNWVSFSLAQRNGMPADTNWVGNVYHGVDEPALKPVPLPADNYIAYLGRIIEPKGVHLAIAAIKEYNRTATKPLKLKIAGKHYTGHEKKSYWETRIKPELDDVVEYVGFLDTPKAKREFLGNAVALMVPSTFEEPFGMVVAEAFACGTPVIALDSGALPEIVSDGQNGCIVNKIYTSEKLNETDTARALANAVTKIFDISRANCRAAYEQRFTATTMVNGYLAVYRSMVDGKTESRRR